MDENTVDLLLGYAPNGSRREVDLLLQSIDEQPSDKEESTRWMQERVDEILAGEGDYLPWLEIEENQNTRRTGCEIEGDGDRPIYWFDLERRSPGNYTFSHSTGGLLDTLGKGSTTILNSRDYEPLMRLGDEVFKDK